MAKEKRERTVKKYNAYIVTNNCKPLIRSAVEKTEEFIVVDDLPYYIIDQTDKRFTKYIKYCRFDERYKLVSMNSDMETSLDFFFNYIDFATDLYNYPNAYWGNQPNKYMKRYIDYGYLPIVHLPTFAINIWTAGLLKVLDMHKLPYIRVFSAPTVGSAKLNTYDYLVHRFDISKVLKVVVEQSINLDKAQLNEANTDSSRLALEKKIKYKEDIMNQNGLEPENLRLGQVVRLLYQV